jgi:hypothetical protein
MEMIKGNMGWLLHMFIFMTNMSFTTMERIRAFLKRIENVVELLTQPMIYGFFEKIQAPYLLSPLNLTASAAARVELLYNQTSKTFYPNRGTLGAHPDEPTIKLPILSLDIVNSEGETQYDLTDFVETIKVIHVDELAKPCISDIVEVWQLSSGIVLDRDLFKVRYITEDGDTIDAKLNDMTPLFKKDEEEKPVEEEEKPDAIPEPTTNAFDKLNSLDTVVEKLDKALDAFNKVSQEELMAECSPDCCAPA